MMKIKHTAPAAKDFSVKARNTLARRGIAIVGSTWLPGTDGSFANGERGYINVKSFIAYTDGSHGMLHGFHMVTDGISIAQ